MPPSPSFIYLKPWGVLQLLGERRRAVPVTPVTWVTDSTAELPAHQTWQEVSEWVCMDVEGQEVILGEKQATEAERVSPQAWYEEIERRSLPRDPTWQPDGPVLCWRRFRLEKGQLCPMAVGPPWKPGENEAHCVRNPNLAAFADFTHHEAPGRDCNCGFNAFHVTGTYYDLPVGLSEHVVALVEMWGRLEIHSDGVRSQHAEIACLLSDKPGRKLRKVAQRYGVPIISERGYDGFLMEVEAEPVPEGAKPRPWSGKAFAYGGMLGASAVGARVATGVPHPMYQTTYQTATAYPHAGGSYHYSSHGWQSQRPSRSPKPPP